MLTFAVSRRAGDLYGGGNILVKAKNVFKGLQGVDNVYTQHAPLLVETINQLSSNNLSAAAYPYMASSQVSGGEFKTSQRHMISKLLYPVGVCQLICIYSSYDMCAWRYFAMPQLQCTPQHIIRLCIIANFIPCATAAG